MEKKSFYTTFDLLLYEFILTRLFNNNHMYHLPQEFPSDLKLEN